MVTETKAAETEAAPEGPDSKRERSTIDFPYMDLEAAIGVAQAIHARAGSGCQHDELAVQLGLSPSSSGYRTRVATARLFGLLTSERGSERVRLSDLGSRIIDPAQARGARADAFLTIPLFKKLYDTYRGKMIPPPAALQREMVTWGVSAKQAERARQIMERSADTAGFFESGRDRLVMPAGLGQQPLRQQQDRIPPGGGGGSGGDDDPPTPGLHPTLSILLQVLPEQGTVWPASARIKWVKALNMAFDAIYKSEAETGNG